MKNDEYVLDKLQQAKRQNPYLFPAVPGSLPLILRRCGIYHAACGLFRELWDNRSIRHLGVHTSHVKGEGMGRQLSLFDEVDYEKLALMDEMVDRIRERFGIDAIKRVVFLEKPIDHMSDGISREKRTVDYTEVDIM